MNIRSIISAENRVDADATNVRFSVKPNKVFLFGWADEKRIHFDGE